MTRRSHNKSPKGVETRNDTKNAEKQNVQNKPKVNSNISEKTPKEDKTKSKSKKTDVEVSEGTKGEKIKPKSKSKQKTGNSNGTPSNKVNKQKTKQNEAAEKSASQEELDYDETGLDQALKGDSSSESDGSSESDSSSSSESESEEDIGSPIFNEDSEDGTPNESSTLNTNNAASSEESEMTAVQRQGQKRKAKQSGDTLKSKKTKKEKTIKMTQSALQELMNSTIANYERNRAEKGDQNSKSQTPRPNSHMQQKDLPSNQSKSETTIYSRLCPPINNDVSKENSLIVGEIIQSVEQMDVADTTPSDDSLNVQLNSSDENNGLNITDYPVVPLPPPPPVESQHPKERAQKMFDDMVKQAELQKAELAKPPGEINMLPDQIDNLKNIDGSLDHLHNTGSAHVDSTTRMKIRNDLYVELHKLLPRDFDQMDDDENLCLTNRDGKTYHVPPLEREVNAIGTFKRWQIAFKVFMSVYIEEHPTRIKKPLEFIQYMQMIEDMTTTWIWDNVYKYDKRHRRMMQQFPNRFWQVPYQVAKGELKITHTTNNNSSNPRFRKAGQNSKVKKDICRNFNRGKCQYGSSCRYDHKCSTCGKFGHNAQQCKQKETKDTKEVKESD